MKPSPSFTLANNAVLIPDLVEGQKHNIEYQYLQENVQKLDVIINDLTSRLSRLHKKRGKLAQSIVNIVKRTKDEKKATVESASLILQKERIERLSICNKLLDNKYKISSLLRFQPLPELQPPPTDKETKQDSNTQNSDTVSTFLRVTQPDTIVSYLNETGLHYLLFLFGGDRFLYSPLNVDVKAFVQSAPSILASISPQSRQVFMRSLFKAFDQSTVFVSLFDETSQLKDPYEVINMIETSAATIIQAKRVKFFLCSDTSNELLYLKSHLKHAFPIENGLISKAIKSQQFMMIDDPGNSPHIDIAIESPLFEGAKNALICPMFSKTHSKPFVMIAIDKLRDSSFTASDCVLLDYLFHSLSIPIEWVQRSITDVNEADLTGIIHGLSHIASSLNSHEMIQRIVDVGNNLTSSSVTRFFSIIKDSLCEETPGTKHANKVMPIDKGLVCRSAVTGDTLNYYLPRREPDFSVQIDDITEPRVWSMIASPARFNGEIKGIITHYNRKLNTFFSAKDLFIVSRISKCVCPFLHSTCECSLLQESLERNSVNSNRAFNLTVYSLKSIQTAGKPRLFREMSKFCDSLKPQITHRFLVFDQNKLMLVPEMTLVNSEPHLLDAICNMKPTAATSGDRGVIVFPIKLDGISRVFILEFSATLLQLKTTEENMGIMQRTRLLQSFEEPGQTIKPPPHVVSGFSSANQMNRQPFSSSSVRIPHLRVNHSSSRHISSSMNNEIPSNPPKVNLPFIPLPLKSIHEDEKLNSSSMSLFELGEEHQRSSDKLIVVSSSSRKSSMSRPTFENQLDEDSLQIFPFDSFLTNILSSFSMMSTRQLLLHSKIVSLNRYKIAARSLHLIGNSLACPMVFSKLLKIMMIAFTSLFGNDISIKIFDPPLKDASETDPVALNLERDRHIFASIKIPNALTLDRSNALATFADLLSSLMESRTNKPSPRFEPVQSINTNGFNFNILSHSTSKVISIVHNVFCAFHVHELFNCSTKKLLEWIHHYTMSFDDVSVFFAAADSLQFAYELFKEFCPEDEYSYSEMTAFCLSAFFGSCYPHMQPNVKYSHLLASAINEKVSQRALAKVSTILIVLANPSCDILENTQEEFIISLLELLLEMPPTPHSHLFARFMKLSRTGFKSISERTFLGSYLSEISQFSIYFRPITTFTDWCSQYMKEQLSSTIHKCKYVCRKFAESITHSKQHLSFFIELIDEKIEWLEQQSPDTFGHQPEEEEEEANMSLLEAR